MRLFFLFGFTVVLLLLTGCVGRDIVILGGSPGNSSGNGVLLPDDVFSIDVRSLPQDIVYWNLTNTTDEVYVLEISS